MITADCHVHSYYSGDSEASLESVIERAITMGLQQICFTDHLDLDYPKEPNPKTGKEENLFVFDLERYFQEIMEVRRKYQNQIQLNIGVELGLNPSTWEECSQIVKQYPFDFVIGSSHLVKGIDPYYPEYWEGITVEEGYQSYFEAIASNIRNYSAFDTYGHMDYIVRYGGATKGHYSYQNYADILDEILTGLIQQGKALEVNSAGYKYDLGHAHPQTDVLIRYKELGGELLTIGSDAHKPEHLAYDFNRVEEILRTVGFRYYYVYQERKPRQFKL